MSLVDEIETRLPGWMRKTSQSHWVKLAQVIALTYDSLIEGLYQGREASFPGQVDAPNYGGFESLDALPLIGRDRGLFQGTAEPPYEYARRLRQWRQTWRGAGTAVVILEQLAGVLAPNPPRIRLVSSGGVWWTREPDGTFLLQNTTGTGITVDPDGSSAPDTNIAHPWDWGGDVTGVWPIIYAPAAPIDGDEGTYGDFLTYYGEPNKTIGTTGEASYVALVRAVVLNWRAAGVKIPNVVIAFDPASFDPLEPGPYPAAGMPDDNWHLASKVVTVGGRTRRVKSRLESARYWKGEA